MIKTLFRLAICLSICGVLNVAHAKQVLTFDNGIFVRDSNNQINQYIENGITITGQLRIGDIDNDGSLDLTFRQGDPSILFTGIQLYDTTYYGSLASIKWDALQTPIDHGVTLFRSLDNSGNDALGSIVWGPGLPYTFQLGPFNVRGTSLEWSQQAFGCIEPICTSLIAGGTMSIDNLIFDEAYIPAQPVPEPAVYILVIIGLLFVFISKRKYKPNFKSHYLLGSS